MDFIIADRRIKQILQGQCFADLPQKLIPLKLDFCLPKNFCFNCFVGSPLKMMKTAFYFILKALFVLKIF